MPIKIGLNLNIIWKLKTRFHEVYNTWHNSSNKQTHKIDDVYM